MTTQKEIIQQVNDCFSRNDIEGFLAFCTNDVRWNIVGSPSLQGKQAIRDFMKGMGDVDAPEITVDQLLSEADSGMGAGTMKMKNKEGVMVETAFCDLYTFEGPLISKMTSYIIDLQNKAVCGNG